MGIINRELFKEKFLMPATIFHGIIVASQALHLYIIGHLWLRVHHHKWMLLVA